MDDKIHNLEIDILTYHNIALHASNLYVKFLAEQCEEECREELNAILNNDK